MASKWMSMRDWMNVWRGISKKCTERDLNPRVLPHRILSATP